MPIIPQLEIAQFDKRVIGMENENISNPTELTLVYHINELHNQAESIAKSAKDMANKAIDIAVECGRLLTGQKKVVGHGNWLNWIKDNLSFSEETVSRYMRLYAKAQEIKDIEDSENSSHVTNLGKLKDKTLRQAYIATGILPPRKEPELKEKKAPESYTIEHVKYIDGFVKWYQGFKEKFPLEDMSATTVDMLLLDLSAIVRIYQELSQLKRDKFIEN